MTPYHRNIILELNCRHGNTDCVEKSSEMLDNFRNNPSEYTYDYEVFFFGPVGRIISMTNPADGVLRERETVSDF